MAEVIVFVVALAMFLAVYECLRRRAAPGGGTKPPVQWAWLAVIIGAAALALIAGQLTG